MKEYVFLYKVNSNDRDCVAYMNLNDLKENHLCIDGKFNIHGACYCGSLGGAYHNAKYENIKTVLTEEEYNLLCNPKGQDLTEIIKKLESEENEKLFAEIQEEEKEYLMEEYNLNEDDIEEIFDSYYLDYRDRAVVGCIFDDAYDLGYEEAWSCGYISNNENDIASRYFDFEKFGEDLLQDDPYIQLSDGRCVILNY